MLGKWMMRSSLQEHHMMKLNSQINGVMREVSHYQDADTCSDCVSASEDCVDVTNSLFVRSIGINQGHDGESLRTLGDGLGRTMDSKQAKLGTKPQTFSHLPCDTNTSTRNDCRDVVVDFSFVGDKESSKTPTHNPGTLGLLLRTMSQFSEASMYTAVEDKVDTNVNWSELGPNVLWRRHFFNTIGSLFWKDSDLEPEDIKAYNYKIQMNVVAIRNELHYICRMGYTIRLRALCEYVYGKRGMSLCHASLCGVQFGETALHTALTFNQINAAEVLLEFGRHDLVMKHQEHPQYEGMTALHLAVVKGQLHFITYMLSMLDDADRQTLLHTQATGWFLRENFHASGLPLTLAAWTGRSDIVEALVDFGAEPDRQESGTGNNMLHSLVEYSQHEPQAARKTFNALLDHRCIIQKLAHMQQGKQERESEIDVARIKNKFLKQENAQGFTPLTLACRLGAVEMVHLILNLENIYRYPQWEYGPAVTDYFDVSEMTSSIRCRKKTCGMELLAYACGPTCEKYWIYSTQPIKRLSKVLWTAYKRWFLFLGICHIVTMIIFTICALQRSSQPGFRGHLVLSGDIFVLIYASIMLLSDVVAMFFDVQRFFRQQVAKRTHSLYHTLWIALRGFRIIMMLFALLAVVWFLSRFFFQGYSHLIAAPTLLLGWYYTMFFTRLFRDIGIFTAMLNRMVYSNLIYFFIAYGFVVIAFSGAFSCLVHSPTAMDSPPEMQTMLATSWSLLRFTVGLLDLDESVSQLQSPVLARTILFFFIVIAIVLLLNVLIAAMGDTYADIAGKKDNLWRQLKYEAVLLMEKRIPVLLRPRVQLRRHTTYTSDGEPRLLRLLQVDTVRQNLDYRSWRTRPNWDRHFMSWFRKMFAVLIFIDSVQGMLTSLCGTWFEITLDSFAWYETVISNTVGCGCHEITEPILCGGHGTGSITW